MIKMRIILLVLFMRSWLTSDNAITNNKWWRGMSTEIKNHTSLLEVALQWIKTAEVLIGDRTFAQLFFHPHCGAFGSSSLVTVTPGNFPSKTKVKLLGSFCYNDYEGNMNVKKPIGFNKECNNFACAACFLVKTLPLGAVPQEIHPHSTLTH